MNIVHTFLKFTIIVLILNLLLIIMIIEILQNYFTTNNYDY